jgi:uncharacterized protein (TIGR00730 family)
MSRVPTSDPTDDPSLPNDIVDNAGPLQAQANPIDEGRALLRVDPALRRAIDDLLDRFDITERRDLYHTLVGTVAQLAAEHTDVLDLKIATAALAEMAEAFQMFKPYRSVRKVTFFGSARTLPDDPLYIQAKQLATRLSEQGWMVVTGAGPGIMQAGMEGAGRDRSLGVNIRLPHEQGANSFIATDPKLVEMRYFFTRKLMLIKESDAYAVLPGGFGTLDEAFELLTLLQTGKAEPAPIVLLDIPEGTYWIRWADFLAEEVASRGLISENDASFYLITSDIDAAVDELTGFYRNFHSIRWVGDLIVIRLQRLPSAVQLQHVNDHFGDIVIDGSIRQTKPLGPERISGDHPELGRLAFRFNRVQYGRLRELIDVCNTW